MKLEFNICELIEPYGTNEKEFIRVGEFYENNVHMYMLQGVQEEGLTLISGLNIQESAYIVPSDKVKLKGNGMYADSYIFDVDSKYLNMKIIKEIQRLNE